MRDLKVLKPKVRQLAELLITQAAAKGISVIVTNTVRTDAEQQALYAQGRNSVSAVNALRAKAGMAPIPEVDNKIVTKAATAKDSAHYYGIAFDIAIQGPNKKIDWSEKCDWDCDGISDWDEVGAIGTALGLEWGGNWSSMPDLPHFQYTYGFTLSQIRKDPKILDAYSSA